MQSKSPFKKVDIFDGRASSYRNPSTVIQPIVGAIVGKQIAKTASELGTKAITTSMNKDKMAAEAAAGNLKHQRAMEIKWGKGNTGPAAKPATNEENMAKYNLKSYKDTQVDKFMEKYKKPTGLVEKGRAGDGTHGIKPPKAQSTITVGNTTSTKDGGELDVLGEDKKNNPYFDSSFRMTGSPVKHNESAVGSIAGASQESLPPPNQVAESGSYAGTGERMLEMDSNPVGNQSIGRDTDVASQLFGSGQRASMLAMKGTPLHIEDQEMDELDN